MLEYDQRQPDNESDIHQDEDDGGELEDDGDEHDQHDLHDRQITCLAKEYKKFAPDREEFINYTLLQKLVKDGTFKDKFSSDKIQNKAPAYDAMMNRVLHFTDDVHTY